MKSYRYKITKKNIVFMAMSFLMVNSLYCSWERPVHDNPRQLPGYAKSLKRRVQKFGSSQHCVDLVGIGRSRLLQERREQVSGQQYSFDQATGYWMQKSQGEVDFAQQQERKRVGRNWFEQKIFLFKMKNSESLIQWLSEPKKPRKEYRLFTFSDASQSYFARKDRKPEQPDRNAEPSPEEADEMRLKEGVMHRAVIKVEEKRGKKPIVLQAIPYLDSEEVDLDSEVDFEE